MKRFPSELEDIIIDLNHSHRATLASCGLVCRSWLASTRYHLFSSISLDETNSSSFQAIADSPLSTIPSLVREVSLHFRRRSLPRLIKILALLSGTTHLRLITLRDERAHAHAAQLFGGNWASRWCIHSEVDALGQVADCIRLCPQLRSLEVRGYWAELGDLSVLPSFPRSLNTLDLTCDLQSFLSWLLSLDEVPRIANLTLRAVGVRSMPAVFKYLRAVGPALNSLELTFQGYSVPVCFAQEMDLRSNRNLKHLSLDGRASGILILFVRAIYHMRTSCVESLTIRIRVQHSRQDDRTSCEAYPWAATDAVLSSQRFRSLRVVTVDVVETSGEQDVQQNDMLSYIVERMPSLHARGILSAP